MGLTVWDPATGQERPDFHSTYWIRLNLDLLRIWFERDIPAEK